MPEQHANSEVNAAVAANLLITRRNAMDALDGAMITSIQYNTPGMGVPFESATGRPCLVMLFFGEEACLEATQALRVKSMTPQAMETELADGN